MQFTTRLHNLGSHLLNSDCAILLPCPPMESTC